MKRYNQRLFRVARAVVRDDSEAEDVLQESYMHAFAALSKFRGEASLVTWLTRITLNAALRQRAQAAPDRRVDDTGFHQRPRRGSHDPVSGCSRRRRP